MLTQANTKEYIRMHIDYGKHELPSLYMCLRGKQIYLRVVRSSAFCAHFTHTHTRTRYFLGSKIKYRQSKQKCYDVIFMANYMVIDGNNFHPIVYCSLAVKFLANEEVLCFLRYDK